MSCFCDIIENKSSNLILNVMGVKMFFFEIEMNFSELCVNVMY